MRDTYDEREPIVIRPPVNPDQGHRTRRFFGVLRHSYHRL